MALFYFLEMFKNWTELARIFRCTLLQGFDYIDYTLGFVSFTIRQKSSLKFLWAFRGIIDTIMNNYNDEFVILS